MIYKTVVSQCQMNRALWQRMSLRTKVVMRVMIRTENLGIQKVYEGEER